MSPKQQSELDQDLATAIDYTSRLWWGLYSSCLSLGFTPEQAINLLQFKILSGADFSIYPRRFDKPKDRKDEDNENSSLS